jgi:FkbM family methyltransferase
MLCFDIGANVGEKSALFLGLGARVVAVEPQSRCMPELERLRHRYGERFTIVKKAVSDRSGKAVLRLGNRSEVSTLSDEFIGHFGKHGALRWEEEEEVEVTTIGELTGEFGRPDFLKIDTEGFERKVISSLAGRIPFLEFEFTPYFMDDTRECVRLLGEMGPALFNYNSYELPRLEMADWTNAGGMISMLEKIPRSMVHGNIFVKYS